MKSRLERMVGDQARDLWVGTFHSMCVRMLRREYERRKPGEPNIVPAWDDMRPMDKASWIRCVAAAIAAAAQITE